MIHKLQKKQQTCVLVKAVYTAILSQMDYNAGFTLRFEVQPSISVFPHPSSSSCLKETQTFLII